MLMKSNVLAYLGFVDFVNTGKLMHAKSLLMGNSREN